MLSLCLMSKGYIIKQANDDVDTIIVNIAELQFVGQDIDLGVLLIALTPI